MARKFSVSMHWIPGRSKTLAADGTQLRIQFENTEQHRGIIRAGATTKKPGTGGGSIITRGPSKVEFAVVVSKVHHVRVSATRGGKRFFKKDFDPSKLLSEIAEFKLPDGRAIIEVKSEPVNAL